MTGRRFTPLFLGLAAFTFAARAEARIDFDLDGKSDILWHNGDTGALQAWFMDGASRVGFGDLTFQGGPATVSNTSGWVVGGLADFDRNGRIDILWHNGTSGQTLIWYMNGTNALESPALDGAVPAIPDSTGWHVVGTGFFNAGNVPDILWHNRTTGELSVWYLTGTQGKTLLAGTQLANVLKESTGSRVVGVADFNVDGVADIVWHNGITGKVTIWFMNAGTSPNPPTVNTVLDLAASFNQVDSTNFRFAGTESANADAVPDLLWHHQITGETKIMKVTGGLGFGGTDTVPLYVADLSGWRIANGTAPPRQYRRGGNCQPLTSGMAGSVSYSGTGITFWNPGTKIICPIQKTTSGPGQVNDNLGPIDLQFWVPSPQQPQASCRVNTNKTTSGDATAPNWVGIPASDVTVGSGNVLAHITPQAHTEWWRPSDWDYASIVCEYTSGSVPITLQQYWVSEDGVFQKQRIYSLPACTKNSATTSSWYFIDGGPGSGAGGFLETFTNGNNNTNPPGGFFRWDCGHTLSTRNDMNTLMDFNFMPNLAHPWSINDVAGTPVPMPIGAAVGQTMNNLPHPFSVQSSGLGDAILLTYRTH